MIQVFKESENPNIVLAQINDQLRFPIDASWMVKGEQYGFRILKLNKNECQIPDELIEVNKGSLRHFNCMVSGSFSLRVKEFYATENKQFAILMDGKQIGKTFKSNANSMPEYVEKIVKHFNKLNSWNVTSRGNIIDFKQIDDCDNCGKSLSIDLGTYAKINQNNPTITAELESTLEIEGTRCYNLNFNGFVSGNKAVINGTQYLWEENDTEQTFKTKILGEESYYCLPLSTAISTSVLLGTKTVINKNKPTLKALYDHSDATYDYYLVSSFDVRAGNIFRINGTEKIATETDTQGTINTFFNSVGGYFRVTKGISLAISTTSGIRIVANTNSPEITHDIVSYKPTQDSDQYLITIGSDVVPGNFYYLNGLSYEAKVGDTALDVAYNLYKSNSESFYYYIREGATFDYYANKGYQRTQENLANVELLCNSVKCCDKNSLIFDFNANELGCYQGIISNRYGIDIAFTSIIKVENEVEGELVEFGNSSNAYGIEFDKLETFKLRLPIFLHDVVPFTFEEVNENINGDQVRGKTVITNKRNFVTKMLDTVSHNFMVKVLKSEFLKIQGVNYQFIGEYEIDQQRAAVKDIRQAKGQLTESGNSINNMGGCLVGCN